MNMRTRFIGSFFALLIWQSGVEAQRSPFSSGGSRQRSNVTPKKNFRPSGLPQKQEDHSQDVEFRGYFYLDGVPRFCLYNVQAQFSEWVSLGESTYEEYSATDFEAESETLTVTYGSQSFNLNLYGPSTTIPGARPSVPTRSAPPPSPPKPATPQASSSKVMPPVPKFTPQPPAALVKSNPSSFAPRSAGPAATSRRVHPPSAPLFPLLPGGGSPAPAPQPSPAASPGVRSPAGPTSVSRVPSTSPAVSSSPQTQDPAPSAQSESEIDLSSLPPPPPPPNILPPSAPPDIQPSREE